MKTQPEPTLVRKGYVESLKAIVLPPKDKVPFPELPSFGEARSLIIELTSYWEWQTPGDRSRAIAELLTPALLAGGFIERPVPAFLILAPRSDSGKTIWQHSVQKIYGQEEHGCTLSHATGVGSVMEQIKHALETSKPFFFIDELSGEIKSEEINQIITGADKRTVRTAYNPFTEASTKRFILLFAGNKGFRFDEQLALRVIPIRINYREHVWYTRHDANKMVSQWIEENAQKILASIYSIIIEWARAGYPVKNNVPPSKFIAWSQALNGLVEGVLKEASPLEGLSEVQEEISDPYAPWFAKIFESAPEEWIWKGEGPAEFFSNYQFYTELIAEEGLGIPGAKEREENKELFRRFGNIMRRLPVINQSDKITVLRTGSYFVFRYSPRNKANSKPEYTYALSLLDCIPTDIKMHQDSGNTPGEFAIVL